VDHQRRATGDPVVPLSERVRFAHISFHSMEHGQAAGVHVRELHGALVRRGWRGLLIARRARSGSRAGEYVKVLLRSLICLRRVDLLYVRAHPVALPVLIVARLLGTTTVVEVNGGTSDLIDVYPRLAPLQALMKLIDRRVVRAAGVVVVVSPGLAASISQDVRPGVPVVVIPNAADQSRFRPDVKARPGLPSAYVTYCGALVPWQGLDVLLRAVACPAWPSEVALVIAGGGPLREQVVAAAQGQPQIRYLGVLPHADVPAILANSFAVVSVRTQSHASPVKLYEAIACATPVIASALPGQSELVDAHACGLLIPPSDPRALATAVARLWEHPALRRTMAVNAYAASQGQDWDARAAELASVVEGLVRRRRRRRSVGGVRG
jgi:glycosyltransferase involved in cell wall biosynthesis